MQPLWAARGVSGHGPAGQAPWGRAGSLWLGLAQQEVGRRCKEGAAFLGEGNVCGQALRGSVPRVSRDSALSTPRIWYSVPRGNSAPQGVGTQYSYRFKTQHLPGLAGCYCGNLVLSTFALQRRKEQEGS